MQAAEQIELPVGIERGRFYTSDQVAALVFERSTAWFLRRRRRLVREEGFPRPVSSYGRPRWSGTLLLAWMERDQAVVRDPGGNVIAMPSQATLRERARRVARGEKVA